MTANSFMNILIVRMSWAYQCVCRPFAVNAGKEIEEKRPQSMNDVEMSTRERKFRTMRARLCARAIIIQTHAYSHEVYSGQIDIDR